MRNIALGTLVTFAFLGLAVVSAQISTEGAPVEVAGHTLFLLHSGVGSFTAVDRAQTVNRRLEAILVSPPANTAAAIKKSDFGILILVGSEPIIAVTEADARAEGVGSGVLADRWASAIQQGLLQSRAEREVT